MKVIFSGSASGGHIYPALAIAEKLRRKQPDAEILFTGTPSDTFSDSVAENGYQVAYIDVRGIRRKRILENIRLIRDIPKSGRQIRKIFEEFKPDLVIGTGGYVSGYVVRAAGKAGIPAFIHEQNVIPGLANKLAEKYTKRIFVAFEECRTHFKRPEKVVVTGNPVRRAFITAGAMRYRERMGIDPKSMVLLIFGGSQGAERLNEVVLDMMERLKDEAGFVLYFITGRWLYPTVKARMEESGLVHQENYHVMDYAEAIYEYYGAADLIIGRSGAITVSEIAVCGKASILIPSPNVTGNHQYFNAKTLSDKGGAILMEEAGLTGQTLADEVLMLKNNKVALNRMAEAAAAQGRTDVTDIIYDYMTEECGPKE